MNRTHAKELLPFIQAFAEGKEIQQTDGYDWYDLDNPDFMANGSSYRIKPGPKYRPFKDAEECWQEMQKHKYFGWVKIDDWYCTIEEIRPTCIFCHGGGDVFYYEDVVKQITFIDGTPFGMKEED